MGWLCKYTRKKAEWLGLWEPLLVKTAICLQLSKREKKAEKEGVDQSPELISPS